MRIISDEEFDILKEVINVGVGHSASALSELLHDEVHIEIPEIIIDTLSNIKDKVSKKDSAFSILQKFSGEITGETIIFFSKKSIKPLVKAFTGEDEDDPTFVADVLKEISNILINYLIGAISNFLGEKVEYSLPVVVKKLELEKSEEMIVMLIKAKMELKKKSVSIDIVVIITIKSLEKMKEKIKEMI